MKFLAKKLYILIITFLFSSILFAQEQKVGLVSFNVLMQSSPQFREVMESLQGEFQPRQRELQAKQQELQGLAEKVQKDAAVMGATERTNAERELRDLQRDVNRLGSELQEDINLRQNEEIAKLQRSLLEVVNGFAQNNGFDIVFASDAGGVLYGSQSVNITTPIAELLQAQFESSE